MDYKSFGKGLKTIQEVDEMLSGFPEGMKESILSNVGRYNVAGVEYVPESAVDEYIGSLWTDPQKADGNKTEATDKPVAEMGASAADGGRIDDKAAEAANERAEAAEKRAVEIEALYMDTRNEFVIMTGELETAKDELKEKDIKIACIREQLTKAKQEAADLEADIKAMENSNSCDSDELERINEKLAQQSIEYSRLLIERDSLNEKCNKLEGGLEEMNVQLEEMGAERDKATGDVTELKKRIKELEKRKSASDDEIANTPITKLRKEHRELDRKYHEQEKLLGDKDAKIAELDKTIASMKESTSVQAVKDARADAETWKSLADEYSSTVEKKDAELSDITEKYRTMKAKLSEAERQNDELKTALAKKRSSGDSAFGITDDLLFYPEELTDFIHMLAQTNMDRLKSSKDIRKREYDLSKILAENTEDSGMQESYKGRIDQAVKRMFEENKSLELIRLGFREQASANNAHKKYVFNDNTRYSATFGCSPSDVNAALNSVKEITNMLLFAKVEGKKETK